MFKWFFVVWLLWSIVSFAEINQNHKALSYLNMIRSKTGLVPFRENRYLDKAAAAHARYIIYNQHTGHSEIKGRYAYSGKTADERIRNAGYGSSFIMENISINTKSYHEAIDTLFSAIYHRFVFLNFERDEIGIGHFKTGKKRKIIQAYVYNFGASFVLKLCQKKYRIQTATYYTNHVCKKNKTMIPWDVFEKEKRIMRRKNTDIVLYPYAAQENVPIAFYNERPDPLPRYKVSGYPVSVQINPAYYKSVRFHRFKLYDASGNQIKKVKILNQKNDNNHLFNSYEYALMPLQRLKYDTWYTAFFDATLDGKRKQFKWSFHTKQFHEKVYHITQKTTHLKVKKATSIILDIVPKNKKDIVSRYIARGGIKVSFLNPNTLKVSIPEHFSLRGARLELSHHRTVFFSVK